MSRDKIVLQIAKDLCSSYGRCEGCHLEGNCDVGISAQVIYDCDYRNLTDIVRELESLRSEWEKTFTGEGIQFALDIVKKHLEGTQ